MSIRVLGNWLKRAGESPGANVCASPLTATGRRLCQSTMQREISKRKVRRRATAFIGCIALALNGPFISSAFADNAATHTPLFPTALTFDFTDAKPTFEEVKSLILKRYYSKELTEEALYWGAIAGMLRLISPPKTPTQGKIWSAPEYQRVLDGLRGQQTSLGIRSHFDRADAALTVKSVTPGSAADGRLMARDRIMRIDGRRLTGLTVSQIDKLLNVPKSGSVTLTVIRDINVLQVELQPTTHDLAILEPGILPDNVAYLRVRKMTTGIALEARRQLHAWEASGVKSVVLDLRDNGGGVFIEGLRLAESFLKNQQTLVHIVREGRAAQSFLSGNDDPLKMRVAVLSNARTASAAEIAIAALVDAGRATAV
ncbi:MAG: PDZ domain-containing protein, partial [Chromatiales bacterium]|nr:PDZ domain-containing protein [Chromatiales bacterium]